MLGVGRYLYRDGVPNFVRKALGREAPPARTGNGQPSRSQPPAARTEPVREGPPPSDPTPDRAQGSRIPGDGRSLYAWVKEHDENNDTGLLKYLSGWAKTHELPPRMVDWDQARVTAAWHEIARRQQAMAESDRFKGETSPLSTARTAAR